MTNQNIKQLSMRNWY